MATNTSTASHIESKSGLLAILLGLMVGFGNVWALPQHVMQSGGLVYVLVFAASMMIFGLPFLVAELALGKMASEQAQDPVHGLTALAANSGKSQHWGVVGRLGLMVCAFTGALYSMVSGWSLAFFSRAISGQLSEGVEQARVVWSFVSQNSEVTLFWYLISILCVVVILSRVLHKGLERYSKRLMTLFAVCLFLLTYLAVMQGNWRGALSVMTHADMTAFDASVLYKIIVHCFYTLVIGTTAVFMLGLYAHNQQSFARVAVQAIFLDTVIAIVMCFVVLSFLLSTQGVEVESNFELVFIQIPSILSGQGWGQFILILFYAMLFILGITTCAVVMEPLVAWVRAQFHYSRLKSARLMAIYISLISVGIAFSFSVWKDQKISLSPKIGDKIYTWFEDATFYSILTYVSLDVLLPIAALLMIYVAGFVVAPNQLTQHVTRTPGRLSKVWAFIIRNVTPVLICAVLLETSGLLNGMRLWFGWSQ